MTSAAKAVSKAAEPEEGGSRDARVQVSPHATGGALPPVHVVVRPGEEDRTRIVTREWGRAGEIFRWRGPWRFLLLALREVFRPLVYWHAFYIVQNDMQPPLPAPAVKGEFQTRIYAGQPDLRDALVVLARMEDLSPAEITLRLKRGDAVAVTFEDGMAIGYLWMTFTSGLELVFDTRWKVGLNEAVLYDTFVSPAWRGRGIHACMDVALNNWAYPRGIIRAFASISAVNNQSLGITRRRGKSVLGRVVLLRVRGFRRTRKLGSDELFTQHFQEQNP